MANDLKGEGKVKALGQDWTLKLPFTVAKRLKSEHGIDLLQAGASLGDLENFDLVLAAALEKEHPGEEPARLAKAGEILDDVGMKPVIDALQPAIAAFLGVPVEDLKKAGKNPQ